MSLRNIIGVYMAVLMLMLHPSDVFAFDPHRPGSPSVFIDPAYGGRDHGPVLDGNIAAKSAALELARKIAATMGTSGITAHLSRQDETLSTDDRLARLHTMSADVFMRLQISESDQSCIRIAAPSRTAAGKTAKDADRLMYDLWQEKQMKANRTLSLLLAERFEQERIPLCGRPILLSDPLLDKIVVPGVEIDLRIGGRAALITDAKQTDRIAKAVRDAMRTYFSRSQEK